MCVFFYRDFIIKYKLGKYYCGNNILMEIFFFLQFIKSRNTFLNNTQKWCNLTEILNMISIFKQQSRQKKRIITRFLFSMFIFFLFGR